MFFLLNYNFKKSYNNLLFKDQLPEEDIAVPLSELPDPEADNGNTGESVREQENKWTDLALNQLAESNTAASNWIK